VRYLLLTRITGRRLIFTLDGLTGGKTALGAD